MIIQHNITALNAYNRLSTNNSMVSKNLEKLSSGYRINRAGDDAAGLAISEKMRAQITGLERATLNAQDGISLVQTAEGALTEVHSMLNRMVELGTQSSNGTYQPEDRQKIQSEVDALLGEIDRISQATNFNGINLLDGTLGLDTDAFKYQYSDAVSGGAFTTVDVLRTEQASTTAAKGEYSISLGDLNVAKGASGTLTLTVGGEDISITLNAGEDKADSSTAGGTYMLGTQDDGYTTTQLRDEIVKIIKDKFDDAGSTDEIIDGKVVNVAAGTPANSITFIQKAAPTSDADLFKLDAKFDIVAAGTGVGGEVVHGSKVTQMATAASAASRAHANIKIDVSAITNGATMKIGAQTLTFFTKESGKTAVGGANAVVPANGEIDLTNYSEDDLRAMNKDELQRMIVDKVVSGYNAITNPAAPTDWEVTKDSTNPGSIHITQMDPTATDFSTKSLVLAQVSSLGTAKNASVTLEVDDSMLRNGSTVKIGDKTFEFTNDPTKLKNKSAIAVVVAGLQDNSSNASPGAAAQALATAAGGAVTSNNPQAVRVNAASKDAASPMVSGKGLTLQIGDTSDDFNQVTVAVDDMGTVGLGINGLKVTDQGWSQDSIEKIKGAIEKVSVNRGNLGALQNRLEHTINNLTTTSENMTAAESRVRDTDMAKEMMDFTKNNVLVQAAQAMLAQANQQPQQVLQLLR